jgi:hypothetical protein
MTQFVTAEALTNKELQVEFMHWVGLLGNLVIPEGSEEVVLSEADLNKLRKVWLNNRAEREAIITAQMDELMEIMS